MHSTVKRQLSILFRCDASPSIGLGHVVRSLALADELREGHGAAVSFAMRSSVLAVELVTRRGYQIWQAADGANLNQEAWLRDCIQKSRAQVLVVDVRDDLSKVTLQALAGEGTIIALLDDLSERRWAADLAFYPPVPQVDRVEWSGFCGRLCIGWEWIILRKQFAEPVRVTNHSRRTLLVAMGGSDPAGLTLKAVRALDRLDKEFEPVIIVGTGFCHRQALQDLLRKTSRRFTVREDVSEMSAAMSEAALAVCSFGMTAYELAAIGVPSVYVCLTDDHAQSASALVAAGVGISVGVDDEGTEARLVKAVQRLFVDGKAREQMSSRASALLDGRGADRIAKLLVSAHASRVSSGL
jgi:spore coat polysaccharide biosynthesis predicted glycosyltransferase SpsG